MMINKIGATPSFQSYVNIKYDGMNEAQKEMIDRKDFKWSTDMLRNNKNNDVVIISASKGNENDLTMEIIENADNGRLLKMTQNLPLEDAALNMANIYFLYNGRMMTPDLYGKFPTGGTLELIKGDITDYLA